MIGLVCPSFLSCSKNDKAGDVEDQLVNGNGNSFFVKDITVEPSDAEESYSFTYNNDGSIKTINGESMESYENRLNMKFNKDGYVTSFLDDGNEVTYDYDSDGHVKCWYYEGKLAYYDEHGKQYNYTYTDGNVDQGGDTSLEKYYWSTVVNKANLDLNHLWMQTYEEDIYGLALMGFLGKKNVNLLDHFYRYGNTFQIEYVFNDNGTIHSMYNSNRDETFTITYY